MEPGWTVADVLSAGGGYGYNVFYLIRADRDVGTPPEQGEIIAAPYNLLGINESGAVYYQAERHVLWSDLMRASDAGLYLGDPTRLVVLPFGAAGGGLTPLALGGIVTFLFENWQAIGSALGYVGGAAGAVGAMVRGAKWVKDTRKRWIALQWRRRGLTAPRIRELLRKLPQWDLEIAAERLGLTTTETRVALTSAGYVESPDDLWRLGDSEEARERQHALDQLADAVEQHPDADWGDEFLMEVLDAESDKTGAAGLDADRQI